MDLERACLDNFGPRARGVAPKNLSGALKKVNGFSSHMTSNTTISF